MREVSCCVLFHYSEEEVTFEVQKFTESDHEGLICSSKSIPEYLTRVPWLLLLLISLSIFVLMLATLVQVAVPQELTQSILEKVQQQLNQINVSLAGLCRPCPWEWELFQGSCYLFSRTLGSWEASVTSCQNLGAHLVIVNSFEEQQFLKYLHIRKNELTWIGLSDHRHEGSWHWVDGTPLGLSFWKDGEPNNEGDEDCVELSEDKWNDKRCAAKNFWICEKPSAPCPGH
ncbi:CD209 antigen-like protein 2 [Microtus ochrogaster]|uniref:CD209 antigen-like protein 2 n=1 Tax=Microtus ochrogaster TaxID=79684 RepID=A0A8J6GBB5_MICOH|nr:CD209 antigen-like protein 2 [Microtus ochrogaster]